MFFRAMKLLLLIFLGLLMAPFAWGCLELEGLVVQVSDGDTLTLLTPKEKTFTIRLAEIDAPESNQPYGRQAKRQLIEHTLDRTARIEIQDVDHYGRLVGTVWVEHLPINALLVYQGAAWAYRYYLEDERLLALEQSAQQARQGLWALPKSQWIPPWEWRKLKDKEQQAIINAPCENKKRCSEIHHCLEATFYFNQCGWSDLDGNENGIPCEKLCRD